MDELERALDDCLQRLASGKASLAQCLARYPQYAAELRPLLEAAIQLQRGKEIRPSGAVRDRSREKIMTHIAAHPRQPRKTRVVSRLALMGIGLVCVLLIASTTAAQAAMPGQFLYPWKLSTERAWRAAWPNPVAADLFLADRRANELAALAAQPTALPVQQGILQANPESQVMGAYIEVLDRLDTETTDLTAGDILPELQAHQDKLLRLGIHVQRLDDILRAHQPKNRLGQGDGNQP